MNNIGSIISIKIHEIEKNQANLLPNAQGKVSLSGLSIINTIEIPFTQETGECSVKEKETANGSVFTIQTKCKCPRLSSEEYLDIIRFKYFILEIQDGNKQSYIIGNSQQPVNSITNKIIPAKTAGYNGREFTFTSEQTHDILYI